MGSAIDPMSIRYGLAELSARLRWLAGEVPFFDANEPDGPFTTVVAFLPGGFASRLHARVNALPDINEHFRYPAGQMHVTIRNVSGCDLRAVRRLLRNARPICVTAKAFAFTRETLLLSLAPQARELRGLRATLGRVPGAPPIPLTRASAAFVNVLRLNGRVTPRLRAAVVQHRMSFGGERVQLSQLTLIRTDKVGTPRRSEVLDQVSLEE